MSTGRRALAVMTALALAAGAGCGGDVGTETGAAAGEGAPEGFEPVTVTDCNGVESTFESLPENVVSLTSSVLEMLFWLGVEERVVGTGSPPSTGELPQRFDAEAQEVPKLAGEYEAGAFQPVPREILIGNGPDFVVAGFSSNFDAEGAASQSDLADRGINSYMAFSTSCSSALTGPQEDLELTYRDLENLGEVFGVSGKAEQLITDMQETVDGVQEQLAAVEETPTVFPFEYDEGTETMWAPGNRQTINPVISLAGGRNIFDDFDTDYNQVGWEEVIGRDPDYILIITYSREGEDANADHLAEAEDFLRSYEPIQNMDAVNEGNFVHLLYEQGSVGGVRNAEAVASLAAQLHPELAG